ncbi:hypothetical protein Tco_0530030, partial [Tanacetum coccineum]
MSESVFRKRFRSSYESLPSLSPTDLPTQKRYRGMSELVEDSEEDEDEKDEEIEESLDSDSLSEDAEDEGPTTEDEDPVVGDEGLAAEVEGPGTDDESYGLDDESHGMDDESRGLGNEDHNVESDGLGLKEEEEVVPEGSVAGRSGCGDSCERAFRTWDGMVYIDVLSYPPPPPVQTPPSNEWTSGSLPISPSPSVIPSPMQRGLIHDHAVRLEELSPALFERYTKDIGELFTRSRAVRDEIFSLRYQFRSLEYEHERVADLRLQLIEERRARLELAEVVDGMRRGQEPRGDEKDEEIEESLDSDSLSEDAEDEGPTTEDEDPVVGDEGLAAEVEGPGTDDESYGLDDESHGMDDESRGLGNEDHNVESDGLGLKEEEEVVPEGSVAGRSGCGDSFRLEELSPALFERYTKDIGELFTRSRAVRDEIFSLRYQFRSLEYEHERVALIEERRARLELAKVVDSMKRGREPRGVNRK